MSARLVPQRAPAAEGRQWAAWRRKPRSGARGGRAPARLFDLVVIALVPQAVGRAHEAVVVPAVHGVASVHEHAEELVRLRVAAPVAHVRRQVQARAKVHLPRVGLGFTSTRGRSAACHGRAAAPLLHTLQQLRQSKWACDKMGAGGALHTRPRAGYTSKRAAQCSAIQGVLALHKQR